MTITPQAIKDQEFQTKFRGYDAIEVKAYLELVAEEFFELLEKIRIQEEDLERVHQEKALLEEVKERLDADIERALATTDEVRRELSEKDEKLQEQAKEIEELQTAQADFEEERKEFEEEVSAAQGSVSEFEEQLRKKQSEIDGLHNKIELLEEQNKDLKNGEVDLKRTIGAAQLFADNLKDQAVEEAERLKRESEEKAEKLLTSSNEQAAAALARAKGEIERLRGDAFAELSRLPDEIAQLNRQRRQVKEDLRKTLTTYMEQLEALNDVDGDEKHYEYDELFQKIEFTETFEPVLDEVANPLEDLENTPVQIDELDGLDMDLLLPEGTKLDDDEEDDDLRSKLDDGGVAYLSDI